MDETALQKRCREEKLSVWKIRWHAYVLIPPREYSSIQKTHRYSQHNESGHAVSRNGERVQPKLNTGSVA